MDNMVSERHHQLKIEELEAENKKLKQRLEWFLVSEIGLPKKLKKCLGMFTEPDSDDMYTQFTVLKNGLLQDYRYANMLRDYVLVKWQPIYTEETA